MGCCLDCIDRRDGEPELPGRVACSWTRLRLRPGASGAAVRLGDLVFVPRSAVDLERECEACRCPSYRLPSRRQVRRAEAVAEVSREKLPYICPRCGLMQPALTAQGRRRKDCLDPACHGARIGRTKRKRPRFGPPKKVRDHRGMEGSP